MCRNNGSRREMNRERARERKTTLRSYISKSVQSNRFFFYCFFTRKKIKSIVASYEILPIVRNRLPGNRNFDNYICSAKNACDSIVIESKKQEDLFLKSFSMYKKHRYQNLFNQCLDLKVCS